MEVERIVDHRVLFGEPEFLVKWKRKPYTACQWRRESEARSVPGMEEGLWKYRKFLAKCRTLDTWDSEKLDQEHFGLHEWLVKVYIQATGKLPSQNDLNSLFKALKMFHEGWRGVVLNQSEGQALTRSACAMLRCLSAETNVWDALPQKSIWDAGPFMVITDADRAGLWARLLGAFAPGLHVVDYAGDASSRMVARHHGMSLLKKWDKGNGGAEQKKSRKRKVVRSVQKYVNV